MRNFDPVYEHLWALNGSVRAHSSFARLAPHSSLGFLLSAHSGRARSARAGCSESLGTLLPAHPANPKQAEPVWTLFAPSASY